MSNEELVKLIQTGERNRLPDLWEQVRQMVYQQARRWAEVGGVETEDLIQAGFIALLSAVDSYDSSAGAKFSTWFFQHIRREFANACGQRTERQKRDPLQGAVSLDAPLDNDESDGGTLGDIVPDLTAEAAILDVDERDRLTRLRAVVRAVLAELPENLRKVIVGKYWHKKSGQQNQWRGPAATMASAYVKKTAGVSVRSFCFPCFFPLCYTMSADSIGLVRNKVIAPQGVRDMA